MKHVIFFIVVLLLIMGCSKEKTLDVEEQPLVVVQQNNVPSSEPVVEVKPSIRKEPVPVVPDDEVPAPVKNSVQISNQSPPSTPVVPEPPKILDAKSREVLEKADLKVQSFSYIYREPPYNSGSDKFIIKGDKVHIALGENSINLLSGLSDVFLDLKTKQAVGYCVPRDAFICPEREGIAFPVEFKEYYHKTNTEWVDDILEAKSIGSEQLNGRNALVLSAKVKVQPADWSEVKFLVDEFYGLPMRVDVKKANGDVLSYNFDDIAVNAYNETDVTPPKGY